MLFKKRINIILFSDGFKLLLSYAEVEKKYYPIDKIKLEINIKNKKMERLSKAYYENGGLMVELNYKEGKKEGIIKGYYKCYGIKYIYLF